MMTCRARARARGRTVGSVDLCFRWQGPIKTALEPLVAHDLELVDVPVDRRASNGVFGHSVSVRDPGGNLLELLSIG